MKGGCLFDVPSFASLSSHFYGGCGGRILKTALAPGEGRLGPRVTSTGEMPGKPLDLHETVRSWELDLDCLRPLRSGVGLS